MGKELCEMSALFPVEPPTYLFSNRGLCAMPSGTILNKFCTAERILAYLPSCARLLVPEKI